MGASAAVAVGRCAVPCWRNRRMAMNATERVVNFICETEGAAIAPEAREFGRRALLDTIGVALAGVDEPAARLA